MEQSCGGKVVEKEKGIFTFIESLIECLQSG